MYFSGPTIDDILNDVFRELKNRTFNISATRSEQNGRMSEIIGATLCLENPRARISRTETRGKPFSALGEFLWYLSKENKLDFIKYYIPKYQDESTNGKTIYGGYGPRLFNFSKKHDQVENIISLLKKRPNSRRAAIQIFSAKDIAKDHKEIPCTCTLQFILREKKLHMVTYMRSNDAYLGLPHDIFAFTMLQEIIASALQADLGTYNHSVGSLHLYENHITDVNQYLDEGFQPTKIIMPEMPIKNLWKNINSVLKFEKQIRLGKSIKLGDICLPTYWTDLIILLKIHSLIKEKNIKSITKLKTRISHSVYSAYIEHKLSDLEKKN